MSTVWIVDIDATIADNTHRMHLLKKECISCGNLVAQEVGDCSNCSCNVFETPTSSWIKFTDPLLLSLDKPIKLAQDVILKAQSQLNIQVHYITGRQNNAREVTQKWLETHFNFNRAHQSLITREICSYTAHKSLHVPASKYKETSFLHLKDRHGYTSYDDTFMFFDDDPYVLPMYSKYGIAFQAPNCWQVMNPIAPADAEPTFNK